MTLSAFDINTDQLEALKQQYHVQPCVSLATAVQDAAVVVLAVKPNILANVLPQLREALGARQTLVVSIAAGKPLAFYKSYLGRDMPVIRVMPNINAKVGAAASAFCCSASVTSIHKEAVITLFSSIGTISEISEAEFPIFSALVGSAPAFAYLFVDVLARAAQKAGMPKKKALAFSAQMALGSAKMILESTEHPWELIDQVCSPGGTTIEGIYSLEQNHFESTLIEAFDAILAKDSALAQKE